MHVWITRCMLCKLPCIGYMLPLNKQQQTMQQRLLIYTPGQGCRYCSKLHQQTSVLSPFKSRSNSHHQKNVSVVIYSFATGTVQIYLPSVKLEWSARGLQIYLPSVKLEWSARGLPSSWNRPPSDPGPSKDIHKSVLMKLVLNGAIPGT
eukprot:1161475-Pelagomonas_calceolata.AAC.2